MRMVLVDLRTLLVRENFAWKMMASLFLTTLAFAFVHQAADVAPILFVATRLSITALVLWAFVHAVKYQHEMHACDVLRCLPNYARNSAIAVFLYFLLFEVALNAMISFFSSVLVSGSPTYAFPVRTALAHTGILYVLAVLCWADPNLDGQRFPFARVRSVVRRSFELMEAQPLNVALGILSIFLLLDLIAGAYQAPLDEISQSRRMRICLIFLGAIAIIFCVNRCLGKGRKWIVKYLDHLDRHSFLLIAVIVPGILLLLQFAIAAASFPLSSWWQLRETRVLLIFAAMVALYSLMIGAFLLPLLVPGRVSSILLSRERSDVTRLSAGISILAYQNSSRWAFCRVVLASMAIGFLLLVSAPALDLEFSGQDLVLEFIFYLLVSRAIARCVSPRNLMSPRLPYCRTTYLKASLVLVICVAIASSTLLIFVSWLLSYIWLLPEALVQAVDEYFSIPLGLPLVTLPTPLISNNCFLPLALIPLFLLQEFVASGEKFTTKFFWNLLLIATVLDIFAATRHTFDNQAVAVLLMIALLGILWGALCQHLISFFSREDLPSR